jgi:putative membrane protein
MRLLLNWILSALGLWAVSRIVPGFELRGFGTALVAVIVIGLINATLGLILKVLTFPLTILTLGVFWFMINALMLWLASAFVPGFRITGFLPAFVGALVLSLINMIIHHLTRPPRQRIEYRGE